MTEVLTTGLAQLGALDVIASSSTQRYQKMDKPPAQIARELNVDALVDGSVQRSGNRVLVTARLIDGTTARQLWARSYERDYRDALSLQAEIANVIAEEIGAKLTARTRRPTSANPEAQDAFLRGEFLYRRGDFKRSFALYQQAIEKDPHFAAAYTRLPFYYLLGDGSLPMEEGLAQWKAAVKRALELDPNLDEAHRAYGVLLGGSEWNWKDAEREYKIALGLNPNLALAHQQYGGMLAYTGRADEAIQELKRAQRLDPASGSVGTMLALAYWFARRPDELFAQAQRFEDLDARWPPLFRAYAHELKGEFDQAIRDLMLMPKEDGAPIVERYIVERAHAYTVLGKTKEARDSLIELLQLSQKRKVGAWFFACLYAALGEKDRAFEWLDKAYMERPSEMVSFAASPDMDPLRSDPRYEAMLRRMGIPER
jgi:tetratricopeptide (TPR) repeat protein